MPTKITFFFYLSYVFNVLFCNRILSYFAKPNFLIYDEWFDDDLEKNKLKDKNKKIKTISNIHEYFYEKSNYKVGGSENNFQLDVKVNEKKQLITNYFENIPEKYKEVSNKEFQLFKKLLESKVKFNITKKFICSLLIFGLVFIFGLLHLFISQSKKNESNIINKTLILEKEI